MKYIKNKSFLALLLIGFGYSCETNEDDLVQPFQDWRSLPGDYGG
jgi:hypothetical protein